MSVLAVLVMLLFGACASTSAPSCLDEMVFVDQVEGDTAVLVSRAAAPVRVSSLRGMREGEALGDAACSARVRAFLARTRSGITRKDITWPLRL